MKKRFLTAAMLAAAATILIGGCEQQGAGEDGERGGSFSMTNQQVYADGVAITEAGTYTVKMLIMPEEGNPEPYGEVIGTVTDGKLSFTLPDTIDESVLTAFFDEFYEGLTVNPPNSKVLEVLWFAVYDGEGELIGQLVLYSATAKAPISFLYSPGPFTVTGVDSNKDVNFEIAAGTGWNTVLWDDNDDSCTTGTPPADAKWRFYASR